VDEGEKLVRITKNKIVERRIRLKEISPLQRERRERRRKLLGQNGTAKAHRRNRVSEKESSTEQKNHIAGT